MNETVPIKHEITLLKICRGNFRYGFHRVKIWVTEVFTFLATICILKFMDKLDLTLTFFF